MYKLILALAAVFFAFILWVIYLANTGGHSVFFDLVRAIPYGDKVGHFCLFGALTFIATVGLKFKTFRFLKLNIYYGAAFVLLFVIVEELSQGVIPSRTLDAMDLLADFIGIGCAALLAYTINRLRIKQLCAVENV
jgi:VanZ family protein